MRRSLKAALLSGLLFPGLGEFWLKYPLRGIALLVAVAASLATIAVNIGRHAYAILERLESEGGTVDLVALTKVARISSADDETTRLAWLVLAGSWIFSILDAYLLGDDKDRQSDGSKGATRSKSPG